MSASLLVESLGRRLRDLRPGSVVWVDRPVVDLIPQPYRDLDPFFNHCRLRPADILPPEASR